MFFSVIILKQFSLYYLLHINQEEVRNLMGHYGSFIPQAVGVPRIQEHRKGLYIYIVVSLETKWATNGAPSRRCLVACLYFSRQEPTTQFFKLQTK